MYKVFSHVSYITNIKKKIKKNTFCRIYISLKGSCCNLNEFT